MSDLPKQPTTTEIPKDISDIPDDPSAVVVKPGAYLLELIPVPVSDIDRAKQFYAEQCGFNVDVDVSPTDGVRIVQLTPPGSFCSITLAGGLPQIAMPTGSLRGVHLVVKDIEAARQELIGRGVEVSETEDLGGVFYAWFQDPDGNTWALQHMPWRR
jgi:predicted enzyme related to lactoylglutathione lyase